MARGSSISIDTDTILYGATGPREIVKAGATLPFDKLPSNETLSRLGFVRDMERKHSTDMIACRLLARDIRTLFNMDQINHNVDTKRLNQVRQEEDLYKSYLYNVTFNGLDGNGQSVWCWIKRMNEWQQIRTNIVRRIEIDDQLCTWNEALEKLVDELGIS